MSHQPPFDEHRDDLDRPQTEADVTSQTRFGPRPVPEGHRPHEDRADYRPIPPHGDVSPDGRRAYPRPSPLAKWIVWGGTGLAAAALTAGTVIAARHLLGTSGRNHPRREPYRPEDAPQPRMHLSTPPESPREPEPLGPRPQRRSLMEEIESNTATLTNSVDNVMRTVTSAVTGFRGVAAQTSAIVKEFGEAADLVRDIIDRRAPVDPQAAKRPFHAAPRDPDTGEDPQDDEYAGPADHDPRMHRL